MNIFYIAHARIPTGRAHGLTIVKSCEAFAQAGAKVSLVLLRRENRSPVDIFSIYNVPKVFTVHYLYIPEFVYRYTNSLAFLLQTSTFYVSAFFFMLFQSRKDTIVYTREFPLTLLSLIGFKVIFECHTISHKQKLFFWFARRAHRIIAISGALKDAFIREGFEESHILIAPSGVDLSIFATPISKKDAREKLNLAQDAKIILYTGNFTTMGEDKGIADIIRALPELAGVTFVAAGGTAPDVERYNSLAKEVGVDDKVMLFPHAPQSTLALYQQAADVLLMPFPDTPHYRNHMSPVKMFEYMASDRPIVASDLPTIREVLNETNAAIVLPGNPHSIASAVQKLLTDSVYGEALAKQARADVEQYSWKKRSERILSFIAK